MIEYPWLLPDEHTMFTTGERCESCDLRVEMVEGNLIRVFRILAGGFFVCYGCWAGCADETRNTYTKIVVEWKNRKV